MRKWTTLVLALLLVACCAFPAWADGGIDLTAMTLEELIALHKSVDAEIDARIDFGENAICDGLYVAGESIAPGTYMITCTEAYSSNGEFIVQTFESVDNYKKYDDNRWENTASRFTQTIIEAGQSAMVHISEGMALEIIGGMGKIEALNQTWAN